MWKSSHTLSLSLPVFGHRSTALYLNLIYLNISLPISQNQRIFLVRMDLAKCTINIMNSVLAILINLLTKQLILSNGKKYLIIIEHLTPKHAFSCVPVASLFSPGFLIKDFWLEDLIQWQILLNCNLPTSPCMHNGWIQNSIYYSWNIDVKNIL